MTRLRNVLFLAALVLAGGPLPAQENAPREAQAPPPAAAPQTQAVPPAAPPPTVPPAEAAGTPAARPRPAASEDIFVPTEELQPDEQVTFPVDI